MSAEVAEKKLDMKMVYYLETLEQMDALTSSIRYRMISQLAKKPKTSAQLARDLGISRPKAHYHLQVLVKLGFARFVSDALVNGIVEKYYIGTAHFYSFDKLDEYSVQHPEDSLYSEKLTLIKERFLLNVLEVSREKVMKAKRGPLAADDFLFDFGCQLTTEQVSEIQAELARISMRMRTFNEQNLDHPQPKALPYYRNIIIFMSATENPILLKNEIPLMAI
jgi:hypothetical protein